MGIKKIISNNSGLTLIELLIAMSILSLILTGAFGLMQNSSNNYNKQSETVNEQQNLRATLQDISKYVLEGSQTKVYKSISELVTADSGTVLEIDGKYRIYLYGQLVRVKDLTLPSQGSVTTISNKLGNFIVTKPDSDKQTVRIELIDSKNKYKIDTTLTPRN